MSLREEFKLNKLKLTHLQMHDFAICCCQRTNDTSIFWMLYRLVLYLYFISTWTYFLVNWTEEHLGSDDAKFLLLFGYLAYWIQTDSYLWGLIASVCHFCKSRSVKMAKLYPYVAKIYWISYSTMLPVVVTSTYTFWIFIYDGVHYKMDRVNILLYIVNCVLCAFDFCLIAFPIRYLHFYFSEAFVILYFLITVIYEFAGGYGIHMKPIYKELDWLDDGDNTSYWTVFILVVTGVIYFFFCTVSYVKRKYRKQSQGEIE